MKILEKNDRKLKQQHKAIFHTMEAVVDNIAEMFGPNCEVVLHSFRDLAQSVIKIANGHVTGRQVGSSFTDFGMEILRESESSGKDFTCYHNQPDNGRVLKASGLVIRDHVGTPIGMLCINMDLSVPLFDFMSSLMPASGQFPKKTIEHFPSSLKELVEDMLENIISRVSRQKKLSALSKNKMIVKEMYDEGLFGLKGTIDILANKIGVSRYTIYNYLRDVKGDAIE